MPKSKTSEHAMAGEPIAAFTKRGAGATGAWVCRSQKDAFMLCLAIGARAARRKPPLRAEYHSMKTIDEAPNTGPQVRVTLVARLFPKEASR